MDLCHKSDSGVDLCHDSVEQEWIVVNIDTLDLGTTDLDNY